MELKCGKFSPPKIAKLICSANIVFCSNHAQMHNSTITIKRRSLLWILMPTAFNPVGYNALNGSCILPASKPVFYRTDERPLSTDHSQIRPLTTRHRHFYLIVVFHCKQFNCHHYIRQPDQRILRQFQNTYLE